MAKLTNTERLKHKTALELLERGDLDFDDQLSIFRNYHEGANNNVGDFGAFFTPPDLALDAALEFGLQPDSTGRIVDVCAGIGVLAFAVLTRFPNVDVTCIELNPHYVAIGRRLVPQAHWICADALSPDTWFNLGLFDGVIANPPFGRVRSMQTLTARYSGTEAEFKIMDVCADVADYGVFILPQASAGYRYSGVTCYEEISSRKLMKFVNDTRLQPDIGMGIDTTVYDSWKSANIPVEVACIDYALARDIGTIQCEPFYELIE